MSQVYNGKVPFFTYVSTLQFSEWRSYFILWSFSPYTYISLSITIHRFAVSTWDCVLFAFYPCIHFHDFDTGSKEKDSNMTMLLTHAFFNCNTQTHNLAHFVRAFNQEYCILHPLFPGLRMRCCFTMGSSFFLETFKITYHAPSVKDHSTCPAYLKFRSNTSKREVTFTNESIVYSIDTREIEIEFDQGCPWEGASFTISMQKTVISERTLTPLDNVFYTCAEQFTTRIPNLKGLYSIKCPFNSLMEGSLSYSLSFNTNCTDQQARINVVLAEATAIYTDNNSVREE